MVTVGKFMDVPSILLSNESDDEDMKVPKAMPTEFQFSKSMKCNTCNIMLNSKEQSLAHYQGKAHLKKLKSSGTLPRVRAEKAKQFNEMDALPKKRKREDLLLPCRICDVSFNSAIQYEAHLEGSKHKRKAESIVDPLHLSQDHLLPCVICDVSFNSQSQYQAHIDGAKHKRKADTLPIKVAPSQASQELYLSCKICGVTFNSQSQYQAHVESSKHKRKADALPVKETPLQALQVHTCIICGINFNSMSQYQAHIEGSKHKRNVETLPSKIDNPPISKIDPNSNVDFTNDAKLFHCKVCNDKFNSNSQYEAHVSGQKHKKKLLGGTPVSSDSSSSDAAKFKCEICNVPLNSQQQYDVHMSGQKHKTKCDSLSLDATKVDPESTLSKHIESSELQSNTNGKEVKTEMEVDM